MKIKNTSISIAARIWLSSAIIFCLGWLIWFLLIGESTNAVYFFIAFFGAALCSLPVLIILSIILPLIQKYLKENYLKIWFTLIVCFMISVCYGLLAALVDAPFDEFFNWNQFIKTLLICSGIIFSCGGIAIWINIKHIKYYLYKYPEIKIQNLSNSTTKINHQMENNQMDQVPSQWNNNSIPVTNSNKTVIKGLITAALILLMLIPSFFVQNIITEREERQQQVVNEVSNKWSGKQTISGPYIHIPYNEKIKDSNGKESLIEKDLILLPDNLFVTGDMKPEERPRSIYKVLLYKSLLNTKGNFILKLPNDINTELLHLEKAKICLGISDFKGIEEKISINFKDSIYELSPGLPTNNIDSSGLSANINLTKEDFGKSIDFNLPLKIKGSQQLRFVPLSGNSIFNITSNWNNPSFDGNSLPSERVVTENGFNAKWTFNKANLPFGTILKDIKIEKNNFAFGINMIQPADQYAKTMRSAKYAILFIGLTFALFFIIELMQKKPVHPVQYALVGLALVIFFTLLLSISEFILFDYAFWIAATATIALITLYAKGHFQKWKTAGIFAGILTGLYGFIFILIRLEDTALLVGSIGLFIVLALIMYVTRKFNWYQPELIKN